MIVIFTISSLVHLAIGYALALYLHGLWPLTSQAAGGASREIDLDYPVVPPSSIDMKTVMPAVSSALKQGEPESPADAAPKTVEVQRTETEPDLLAGIEEFRNQLARLRTERLPDDLSDPSVLSAGMQGGA